MQYVQGLPITNYCDGHPLDIAARLELFQQVTYGLNHAHLRGVIHRH